VPKKVVIKGLKCVRRDANTHTRKSQASVIDSIAHNRIEEALATGRSAVSDLFKGTVPFSDLVTSKKVSSRYKVVAKRLDGEKVKVSVTPFGKWAAVEGTEEGTCIVKPGEDWAMLSSDGSPYGELRLSQAHIHVLLRQQARTPGSEGAGIGDRVPYIFTQGKKADIDADTLQFARAEQPDWAEAQGLPIDSMFYFNHGLRSPLETVLSTFVPSGDVYKALGWQIMEAEAMNKLRGQSSLAAFFGTGAVTSTSSRIARVPKRKAKPPPVVVAKKVSGGIGSFFTKKEPSSSS
jgi:DNA polymerase elongation subunit (family B)